MIGYILTYNVKTKRDIVKTNNNLFGKITTINKFGQISKYYYKGILEGIRYIKLSNGCYFLTEKIPESDKYNLVEADIKINEDGLKTGKEHWKDFITARGLTVKNFWY